MKIETRRSGAIAVLIPDDQITIGAASDALRTVLEAAIDGGAAHIVVDGSRVKYMDSTGLGELIAAARRLNTTGGRVGIAAPSPKLREILEITRLSLIFPVGDSEEEVAQQLAGVNR